MRRMMAFFHDLIEGAWSKGYNLARIAEIATQLANRDGCPIEINQAFVGRLGGQGDWYVNQAADFFYMRVYYVLRSLDSSMSEMEQAMEGGTQIGVAEEKLIVNAYQRIRHPLVRQAAASSVRDLANLDASLPRERTPYVLQGPLNPPAVEDGDAPPRLELGELGQSAIEGVDRQEDTRHPRRKRRGGHGAGGSGDDQG
jgi:hypothetical protein